MCSHNDFRFLVETPKWSLELIWCCLNEYKLASHADSAHSPSSYLEIHFLILTNTFVYLDKYICLFEQIHLSIWTNIFCNLNSSSSFSTCSSHPFDVLREKRKENCVRGKTDPDQMIQEEYEACHSFIY